MEFLNLPSLCAFHVQGGKDGEEVAEEANWPALAIDEILTRSSCRLISLTVENMPMVSMSHLRAHLDHASIQNSLCMLELTSSEASVRWTSDVDLLEYLTIYPNHSPNLPQLQTLNIGVIISESADIFTKMLQSQRPNPTRNLPGLKWLTVKFYPTWYYIEFWLGEAELQLPESLRLVVDSFAKTIKIEYEVVPVGQYTCGY